VSDSREPAPEFTLFGRKHDLDFHGDDSVYPEPSTSAGSGRQPQPMSHAKAAEILSQAKSASAAATKIREEQSSSSSAAESGNLLGSIIGAQRAVLKKSSPVAVPRPGEVCWRAGIQSPPKKVEPSDSAQPTNKFLDRANKRSSDVLSRKQEERNFSSEKGEPEKKNPLKRDANGVAKSCQLSNGSSASLGISQRGYNSSGFSSRDSSSSSSSGSPQKPAKIARLESAATSASVSKAAAECNRSIAQIVTLLEGKRNGDSQVATRNESSSSYRQVKHGESGEALVRIKEKAPVVPKPASEESSSQASAARSPKDREKDERKVKMLILISNAVKKHIRVYYYENVISKEEYKAILKKAVQKIKESGTDHVNEDKVKAMVAKYVDNITRNSK
jgi:hypothetical protein